MDLPCPDHDASGQVLEYSFDLDPSSEGMRLTRWRDLRDRFVDGEGDRRGGTPARIVGVDGVGGGAQIGRRCSSDRPIAGVEVQP